MGCRSSTIDVFAVSLAAPVSSVSTGAVRVVVAVYSQPSSSSSVETSADFSVYVAEKWQFKGCKKGKEEFSDIKTRQGKRLSQTSGKLSFISITRAKWKIAERRAPSGGVLATCNVHRLAIVFASLFGLRPVMLIKHHCLFTCNFFPLRMLTSKALIKCGRKARELASRRLKSLYRNMQYRPIRCKLLSKKRFFYFRKRLLLFMVHRVRA